MTLTRRHIALFVGLTIIVAACAEEESGRRRTRKISGAVKCATGGKEYKGIGGRDLLEARLKEGQVGEDRRRLKPASALEGEYERVLGLVPGTLKTSQDALGSSPFRWLNEPEGTAVGSYAALRIAFDGAFKVTQVDSKWNREPTTELAEKECNFFIRKATSRTPTSDEVSACTDAILVDAKDETDPRRRWAYGLAAVLSSPGFLTY